MAADCELTRARILELLYGELAAPARAEVTAHVKGCPTCKAELAALESTRALARQALAADAPAPRARAAILQAASVAVGTAPGQMDLPHLRDRRGRRGVPAGQPDLHGAGEDLPARAAGRGPCRGAGGGGAGRGDPACGAGAGRSETGGRRAGGRPRARAPQAAARAPRGGWPPARGRASQEIDRRPPRRSGARA